MPTLKLFMLLLGCKPPGRHTEQHDVFFGVAGSLAELLPAIEAFWPEPERIHIDAWREVTQAEGYQVAIENRPSATGAATRRQRLFFINLGGYQPGKFEEQHYMVLTVKESAAAASQQARQTLFFKHNHFAGASSHIDDKYGIDVDDLYDIEDILPADQKSQYQITLTYNGETHEDELHLGYLKLSALAKTV